MSDFIILDTPSAEQGEKKSQRLNFNLASIDEWLVSRQNIKLEQKVIFFRLLATMV